MAVLASESPLCGMKGVMGGLLFRVVGDKTVVSKHNPPDKKKRKRKKYVLQELNQNRFAEAAKYAKEITRDWDVRCYYKSKMAGYRVTSAYTAAVAAFMKRDVVVMEEAARVKEAAEAREVAAEVGGVLNEVVATAESAGVEGGDVGAVCALGELSEYGVYLPDCSVHSHLSIGPLWQGGHSRPARGVFNKTRGNYQRGPLPRLGNVLERRNREWKRFVDGGIGNFYPGTMLIRSSSNTFEPGPVLRGGDVAFAMVKMEQVPDRRTMFLQENTIVFVLQGHKYLHFDDHSLTVEAGRMLFMRRGLYVMSEFIPEGLSYEALVLFSTNAFLKAFSLKHIDGLRNSVSVESESDRGKPVAPYLSLPVDHLLASFREQYMSYFKHSFVNQGALLQLKLEELFLLLISGSHGNEVRAWIQNAVHNQPLDIEYVMRQYLFQPLTLNELAELSGRSLASFKRDFQDRFAGSPRKWILQQRLQHAQMLLSNTDQNIVEVALASGFESAPYFSRAFRQAFGETPHVWRANSAIG